MTHASRVRALLAATALVAPAAALAQTAPADPAPAVVQDQAAPAAPDDGEVVVTARYRTESLKSVPIAITAISGASLAERQLNDVSAIATSIPSVNFRSGASNKDRTIFIRGIGTITTSPGVEPSVSTVLDGVVLTRPGQSTLDLGELERVEVLRGPQGTLFGKNASAGVVNIVTRNPSDQFQGFGEAGITSDEEYRLKLGVSGAIVPGKVQALIGGLYDNFAGNARNAVTHDKINGYERWGGRGKLVFLPTDDLKITFIGDYLHTHDTTPNGIFTSASQTAFPSGVTTSSAPLATLLGSYGVVPSQDNRVVANNFDTDVRDENYGGSMTVDWNVGGFGVTSITAYRAWLNHQHQDYDGLPAATTAFAQGEDFGYVDSKQFSQELRLTSPKGKLIDYVLGAYLLRANTDEVYQRNITTLAATGVATSTTGVANYGITDNNYAVFGEANVNFTKNFRAIAGYRSTWDDLSYYHRRTSTNDPNNTGATALDRPGIRAYHNTSGETDRRGDSYRLGLQYDFGERAQAYFTYARGYKGPAYNVYFNMRSQFVAATNSFVPLDEVALSPETSNDYEIGLKGDTADHKFSYNLAAFNEDFDGYQANLNDIVGGAVVSRLINAGSVRSRGVEADVTLRPTKGLTWDISGAYTDAVVVNFNCPVGAPSSCNVNGQPLPYAPRVKIYENAAYRFDVSDRLRMELQSDVSFSSKTQFQLTETPSTIQPAYAVWNASIAFLTVNGGWQLRGYVKNITDTHYATNLNNGTFAGTARILPRDDQRYFGALLRKDF